MVNVTLHDYQETACSFGQQHPHCAMWLSMGFGKTITVLELFNRVMPSGHILVTAPLNIVRSTWLDEIEKWGFNVRARSLIVGPNGKNISREKRLMRYAETMKSAPTMYFINQDLIADLVEYAEHRYDERLVTDLWDMLASRLNPETIAKLRKALGPRDDKDMPADMVKTLRKLDEAADKACDKAAAAKTVKDADRLTKLAAKKVALVRGVDQALFNEIAAFPAAWARRNHTKASPWHWPFPTVVIDESQGVKSPSSERFKALKKVRPAITRLIELTGTPSPQSLLDLWSQIYLLDGGAALGATMTAYKERWFYPTRYVDNRPVAWEPREGAKEEIYDRIKHLVMSVENTSVQMPAETVTDVFVHLDAGEMKAYKEFADTAILDVLGPDGSDCTLTASNAAVLSAKLTQFASGTMYTDPDKYEFVDIHDKKIEMLDYILRNENTPTIVAYRFVSDRIRLERELKKLGHDVHLFDGSREMVRDWNAGKYDVLLLQPASAGHGLNLQDGGHTLVWYTLPVSLEQYLQANARISRQGQKHPVNIYRLLTKGTYDTRLPGMLSGKKLTQDDLIAAVRQEVIDLNNLDPDDVWLHTSGDEDDFGFDSSELL